MAETNNVHNALETLKIADNFLCAQFTPVLPAEHSRHHLWCSKLTAHSQVDKVDREGEILQNVS